MKKALFQILPYAAAGLLIFCAGLACGRWLLPPMTVTEYRTEAGISREHPAKININTAGAQKLSSLPGISSADVKHILLYRTEAGPFGSEKDLLKVTGFTEEKYRSIQDLVTVGG